MAREEREHYYFMSHSQYPRWGNKIWRIKGMFETKFISVAFFARTLHGECKLFHFLGESSEAEYVGGSVHQHASFKCKLPESLFRWKKALANEISTVARPSSIVQFCHLFCWFSPTRTQKRATDMQRNHAGMNFGINYLWLKKTIPKALNPCGVRWNGESRI